jgi:hypothetical protein
MGSTETDARYGFPVEPALILECLIGTLIKNDSA